jgi:hypothetical protein
VDITHFHTDAEQALTWAREQYPDHSPARHAAFANSAVYAKYGLSSPYGGPSLREHIANENFNSAFTDWKEARMEDIYQFLVPRIFGPLTEQHVRFWQKYKTECHDDDEQDIAQLQQLEEKLKFETIRIWRTTADTLREIANSTNGHGGSLVRTIERLAREEQARLSQ